MDLWAYLDIGLLEGGVRSKASRGLVILLVAPSPNFSGIVLAIFKDFKANQISVN